MDADARLRRLVVALAGLAVAGCQLLFPIDERPSGVDGGVSGDGGEDAPDSPPPEGGGGANVGCGPNLSCDPNGVNKICCVNGGPAPYDFECVARTCSGNIITCDRRAQCADPRICCFAANTAAPTGSKCAYPDGGGTAGPCGPEICDPLDAPPCSKAGFVCVDSGPGTPPGKDTPPGYHVCVPSG